MKSVLGRIVILACATVVAGAGASYGQGVFNFSDDFNRDFWDNGQTNAFLPAWSAPGAGGFVVPSGGVAFTGEVVVTGTRVQINANSLPYLDLDLSADPDVLGDPTFLTGSVGMMSWGQRASLTGMPAGGSRWEDFTVLGGDNQTLFQENWQPLATPWKVVAPSQSNGTAADLNTATGNFRWDFVNDAIIEDTDLFTRPTAATPTADFIGATIVYTGTGSNDWANYRVRTRMRSNDDDGMGLIVYCHEDANTLSFYRVHFCGIQTDTVSRRPVRGVGIQKAVITKSTGATQWTALLDSTAFVYDPNKPFDVTVTVQNVSANETSIQVDVINDAVANPTPLAPLVASDTTNPIQSGTVGFCSWAIFVGYWSSWGGVSTPFVQTLDATPATLMGDIFTGPYHGWKNHIYAATATGGNKTAQKWGALLLGTTDLLEDSDGRQTDGTTTGGVPDATYTPYIMYKDGFTTPSSYTVRSKMKSDDNDGMGLVFAYKADGDNSYSYFRAAFRAETGSNFGFPSGISVQKVKKVAGGSPEITNLGISLGRSTRSNMAGLWIKKFGNGALEQVSSANMPDGSGKQGVEFQGPRLVAGDTSWMDYTFEYVSEARDNWGFGPLFRFQDEKNFYRLTFNGNSTSANAIPPSGPPTGLSIQKVVNGVYTELWKDTDPTASGDNGTDTTASNGVGFIYGDTQSPSTFRIWRTRVKLTGSAPLTIRIEIDGIAEDGTESPNYYVATVTDATPLLNGKIGFHSFAQTANELRNIKVWTTDPATPIFQDAMGTADAKGWVDASAGAPTNFDQGGSITGQQTGTGTTGTAAGAPISGFGIRVDLNALGVRDNRYKSGTVDSVLEAGSGTGTINFDGPRAVVGQANWMDYTYGVDLRNFDDDGIGIVFRYRDENNFYRLMFMSQSGNTLGPPPRGVSVQKRLNGGYTELFFTTDFIYTPGQRWHTEVTCAGAHFTIHILELDGPRAGQVHDYAFDDATSPLLLGKVGVTVWGSNGAAAEVNTLDGLASPGLNWTQNFDESGVFDNVTVSGTLGRMAPDLSPDGKINNDDYILWLQCWSGPNVPRADNNANCDMADEDFDGDIDEVDFSYFQRCYSGAVDLDPNCVN